MTHLLNQMLETAKTDKKGLIALKNAAVKLQQFELAACIREMEKEFFPETEEVKQAKKKASEVHLALNMVKLNVPEDICWLISETLKMHAKMKGKFSIRESSRLIVEKERLFDQEPSQ